MMWASVTIINLGCWLLLSPLIFASILSIYQTLAISFLLISLGLANCFYKNRTISILLIIVAIFSCIYGYFFFDHPRPSVAQNIFIIGLLVLMLAIVPPDDKAKLHLD